MQKVNFNIISRDDWELLANKQFGYFYFVVDDVEVLDAGGDLYLGENLIGSGLTIEEIVEYFENPANEHTFPGVTAGDLMPRGDTDIEITERLGIAMQNNKRHIKSGSADLVSIEGIRFDYNEPSTVLKYGTDLGGYQSWEDSPIEGLIFLGDNHFIIDQMIEDSGSYNFVFPVVKGVAGKYGVPELGKNNGYVVVGGQETYVGWCSFSSYDDTVSNFSEMEGVRLEGQPLEDTHVYYIPEDNGVMCVRYASQPSVSQDGTITVDGVEVGCHLAMDNKKDDVAGKSNNVTINFGDTIELSGIGASDSGLGASDTITVDGNNLIYTRNIDDAKIDDLTWNCDDGEYDPASGNYIYHFIASVDGMKPDGAIAVTGGTEQEFIDAYSNGTNVVITGYGDENDPFNRPTDDLDYLVYELATPFVGTLNTQYPGPLPASKYGIVIGLGPVNGFPKEIAPFVTIRYQQSGADQIWNAIAYQKEMAEVTAAALNDLNNRIENVDVDLSPVYAEIEEVAEVTAAALNDLNGRIESLEEIPQWEGDDSYRMLTFRAEEPGSTIGLFQINPPSYISLEYSTDNGNTWNTYTVGNTITLGNVGDTVKFRGNNASFSTSISYYHYFQMTGKISASGDVTSLLSYSGLNDLINRNFCFYRLFYNCTSLTTAPELPATTLAEHCYDSMFYGCTSLTSAPELPATTLAVSCYSNMLQGCTALTIAPELPATTLAQYCYQNMFSGCTSLTSTPELPATTLAPYCYGAMFNGCSSLTTAPEILPATTLVDYCYQGMFNGCTSLEVAPELPATTLVNNCYFYMFYGCTSLNYIKAMFTTTPSASYTGSWVGYVNPTGTFVKSSDATWTTTGMNGVPTTWSVETCGALIFTALQANSTVKLLKQGSPDTISLEYSTDGGSHWYVYNVEGGATITLANIGKTVKFRGTNSTLSSSSSNYYKFQMTGRIAASGDVTSLLNPTGANDLTGKNYCFNGLFNGCTSLTTAPDLPATKLANYCYNEMFYGCTSLTTAPDLPATKLANYCYNAMFQSCTSLTTSPELPATTLADYCYNAMFYGCTALTSAPELPSTTLAQYCYQSMFNGCTSLTSTQELQATTLASYCYSSMFQGCTSLTTAPELPAAILAPHCYQNMFQGCTALTTATELHSTALASSCYDSMFYGCTSLTSAPELPATTISGGCYKAMFQGCTALVTVPEILPATILVSYCYQNMFQGCTALTTAPELPATTLAEHCYNSMFYGCTSLTTAPELPATTLVNYCYQYMFQGCTSLTTAPELPAMMLTSNCYGNMFSGCTSLNYIKAMFTTTPSTTYTKNWVSGVKSTGTFVKNSMAQWNVTGVNGIPSGWTVQTADE